MISFVWSPDRALRAGTGGSENYTFGQVRELNRRGISARIIVIDPDNIAVSEQAADVPLLSLRKLEEVGELDDTVIFVHNSHGIKTKNPSYLILHVPPLWRQVETTSDCTLIATSNYAARLWAEYFKIDTSAVRVVYPFAEPAFARQKRSPKKDDSTRVLFASRLSPEKGIYTFLEMLHIDRIANNPHLSFSVTTAGTEKERGKIIQKLVEAHPKVHVIPAAKNPAAMAALMASHDVVVVPSNGNYWHETFGMVSIEAQHAGCRVVASNDGGLIETDCGNVIFVEPNNAKAVAEGVDRALKNPLSKESRDSARGRFTVAQSVDSLLGVLDMPL